MRMNREITTVVKTRGLVDSSHKIRKTINVGGADFTSHIVDTITTRTLGRCLKINPCRLDSKRTISYIVHICEIEVCLAGLLGCSDLKTRSRMT